MVHRHAPRRLLVCCTLVLLAGSLGLHAGEPSSAEGSGCEATLEAQQSSLGLGYDAFDQTPGEGWRRLAQEECYREAAGLIRSYLGKQAGLTDGERRNLSFHAGQLLAFNNDYAEAIAFLDGALKAEDEPEDAPFQWNAYVRATIAFLRRDRDALEAQRGIMAHAGKSAGRAPNLDVVDALLRNFDKQYKEAYSTR